jgi:hypothetical protein
MNFKTTYGLFAALVILLGLAALTLMTGGKPGDEGVLLPNAKALKLEAKDFDTLLIERAGSKPETLEFTRLDAKTWQLKRPVEAKADAAAVDRVIDDLLAARRDGAGDTPKNLADLGLDKPSLVVTLGRKDGTRYAVSLGNTTLGGFNAQVFALSGDRPNEPLPIRRNTLGSLLKTEGNDAANAGDLARGLSDFRSKDLLLAGAGFSPAADTSAVRISDGKAEVAVAKQPDGSWKYEKPDGYGAAEPRADATDATPAGGTPAAVEPLLTALAAIKPGGAEDFVDAVVDFAAYGLEKDKLAGPAVTVRRKTPGGDDRTETLYIGKKDDASGKVFVRLDGERTVAKVQASLIDPVRKLLERPGSMRERVLLSFAPTGADGLDVKLPGDAHPLELRKVGSPPAWRLFDADGTSQPANARTVTDLLSALNGKVVKDFPEPGLTEAALGFDRPSAELTLYVGGVMPEVKKEETKEPVKDEKKAAPLADAKDKPAEPKANQPAGPARPKMKEPAARLLFGRRDKDLLYVRRIAKDKDGKEAKADFAVSETIWPKVTAGRIEYIDPTLPSFVPSNVTKLAFSRAGDQYVVEKQPDKQPTWVIRLPADRADRGADADRVAQILSELSGLSAVKLWSEKPGERELERYGLVNPRLRAAVSVKDGDTARDMTYSFGAETDDKTGLYARISDRNLVFVVSKVAIPNLESGEIQDPVIFRLDTAKVTGLKLMGWKDVVGQPATRELERKGSNNWTLKGGEHKVNASQAEAFLNSLAQVRAERFVAHKAGPKDDQKLTLPAGALEIQVLLEGEKDPVTLTVGGLDPEGKHLYATSNRLPGDVFLLPKGMFEAVKAKPGYFAAD